MDKIAVFNQKGGVGKTSLTVNLSACLYNRYKKRILVVDCDAQGNSSSFLTGMNPEDYVLTISDIITDNVDVNECIIPIKLQSGKKLINTKIDLLPNNAKIDYIEIPDITTFKDIISPMEDKYDYCLFDCPPQKTQASLCALCASDYVLVPVQTDEDSIQGWNMVLELVEDLKENQANETIEILGVVVNGIENAGLDRYLLEKYKESFQDALFKNTIRHSTIVKQSRYFGLPICYYKKASPISMDYDNVTKELVNRIKERKRKVGKK